MALANTQHIDVVIASLTRFSDGIELRNPTPLRAIVAIDSDQGFRALVVGARPAPCGQGGGASEAEATQAAAVDLDRLLDIGIPCDTDSLCEVTSAAISLVGHAFMLAHREPVRHPQELARRFERTVLAALGHIGIETTLRVEFDGGTLNVSSSVRPTALR